ncbi:MAG TPA: hypothetical protein P5509_11635 [Bacteroidales bacterium]|nr:hypothetical protein [Bacteroidales bacterium]
MKHIIVEGVDRTGKDTLISWLCSQSNNYTVRHFTKPQGNTNQERIDFQKKDFENEFHLSFYRNKPNYTPQPNDMYIWNRSHIGEYVYGQMYRKYDPSWIFDMELQFNFDMSDDIYLILLYADPKFLIEREDGHSLSSKLEDRETEIQLFLDAVDKSHIQNKLTLKVNDTEGYLGNNGYIPIENIRSQISNFLNLIT